MKKLIPIIIFFLFKQIMFAQNNVSSDNSKTETKSLYTIGYQIGGFTYLGFNYEYKISDYIGLHAGAGVIGFTGGVKLHFSNCINCPFVNISFKDGGIGEIGTAGAEFGARLFTFKKNGRLALYAQFGYGYIAYISDKKKEKLFGNSQIPSGIFTFGIGLSW